MERRVAGTRLEGGAQPGNEQLVDWVGNHNVSSVCNGPYGAGQTIRESSPDLMVLLGQVAAVATALTASGSGGWLDLGLVTSSEGANTKPSPGAQAMARDPGALPLLTLCLAGLLGATLALVWARGRWPTALVWVVASPVVIALSWMSTDVVMRLLPNLI